ncbi:MAG: hypothetical protein IPK27_00575 [Rhodanobacteraceae bacterium]|nr:hypothetical protein [Rhodanobacteraceae bacterium]
MSPPRWLSAVVQQQRYGVLAPDLHRAAAVRFDPPLLVARPCPHMHPVRRAPRAADLTDEDPFGADLALVEPQHATLAGVALSAPQVDLGKACAQLIEARPPHVRRTRSAKGKPRSLASAGPLGFSLSGAS